MNITFDPEIAKEVGISASVLYGHIEKIIKEDQQRIYTVEKDGKIWYKRTINELTKELPFLTLYKVTDSLERLKTKGYIAAENLNDSPLERTRSYAIIK